MAVEWRSSLATAELTLGAQALLDGIPVGTETTESTNPSADTIASFAVADLDRAELETLTVAVRASRAGGDPVTAYLDVVSVEVSYTLPLREFTYDPNGSLLDDGAGTTYAHDALGRLTTVTAPGLAASYTLDGAGNRVAAAIDGVTTSYDLDLRGLSTVLSDGTRRYLPGMPGAGYEEAGAWTAGLTNAQGTVLGHAGAAGLVAGLAHYDAWGQLLGGAAPSDGAGYTGEWTDATRLVNLRFRAYDPSLQRFIGGDTMAGTPTQPTTWNRHAYGNANPLTYTDPSGHFGVAAGSTNGAQLMRHFFGSASDLYIAVTGRNWSDGRNVSSAGRASAIRCTVARLNCSVAQFDAMSASKRLAWVRMLDATYGVEWGFSGYFNNVQGILRFADENGLVKSGGWFSVVDAHILEGIQNGLAVAERRSGANASNNLGARTWAQFFTAADDGAPTDRLRELWGTAEQLSTDMGVQVAQSRGLAGGTAERAVLIGFGDLYRFMVANPQETRNYVGTALGGGLAAGAGAAGLFCGPAALACSGAGIVGGFAIGFFGGSSLADGLIDPRSAISYEIAGLLYDGILAVEDLVR